MLPWGDLRAITSLLMRGELKAQLQEALLPSLCPLGTENNPDLNGGGADGAGVGSGAREGPWQKRVSL